jgi:hypothetical protein
VYAWLADREHRALANGGTLPLRDGTPCWDCTPAAGSIPSCLRFAVAVPPVISAFRGIGPTARHETTHHGDSSYRGHPDRSNEQRKPNGTLVVDIPKNHEEQDGAEKQHDVTPVLGEVPDFPLKLPTLLLRHEEGLNVLCKHSLERGSTGRLIFFRSPLQQFEVRNNDGSQVRNIRTRFARHAAEQKATG